VSAGVSTSEAYDRCEEITRRQAANFYYGIRLLPHQRRRAMCAAYAFARRIDDIGDGDLDRDQKLRLLDEAAARLSELERAGSSAVGSGDAVLVALADAHARFSLPAGALGELIEGVRMDVNGVSYERFEDLVLYCRRVAGAIGRVCLAIFGMPERRGAGAGDQLAEACQLAESGRRADAGRDEEASQLADDLGVALQLTNILRDIREDAGNGRAYLPAEDLRRFGLIPEGGESRAAEVLAELTRGPQRAGPRSPAGLRSGTVERAASRETDGAAQAGRGEEQAGRGEAHAALHALVRFEAERAQEWFERGLRLTPMLDRRSAACVLAMAGIYHRLLERIEADPARAMRERVALSGPEKVWVAVRSMVGGRA
jgi:phytoene synthase